MTEQRSANGRTYCEAHGVNLVHSDGRCALCERGVEPMNCIPTSNQMTLKAVRAKDLHDRSEDCLADCIKVYEASAVDACVADLKRQLREAKTITALAPLRAAGVEP